MNAERKWLDLETAADLVYPLGWRTNPPPVDTIERDRFDEARREWRENAIQYEERDDG